MIFNNLVTKEEADKQNKFLVLKKGIYLFEVLEATEKRSSTGNDMIELKLKVFEKPGSSTGAIVYDNLINMDKMSWKILHFLRSIGKEEMYGQIILPSSLIGKKGNAEIVVGKDRNNNDRNSVKDYISQANKLSDDIPFN